MSLPIKLVSTDFDGTIYSEGDDPAIPHELQSLLARLRRQGGKWVINTGRTLDDLLEILGDIQPAVWPDFLVVVEREIHQRNGQGYEEWGHWNQRCHEDQQRLFDKVRPGLPEILRWIRQRFQAQVFEDIYSPFCLVAATNEDADEILAHVQRNFAHLPELTLVRNDIYARMSHAAYNKGTAMAEIARHQGVAPSQVLAAGDHFNDLPMLLKEYAGWLVAPANAMPQVKEQVRRQAGFVSRQQSGLGVLEGLAHYLGWPVPEPVG